MSEDRHGASKYNAKVIMKGDGGTIIMDGLLISSVESIPTIDKCEEENGKYFWCIPLTVAKNICKQKDEAHTGPDSRDMRSLVNSQIYYY